MAETTKEKIYKFGERFSGTKTKTGEPQDYEVLLKRCLKRQELFEDHEFPCVRETAWGTKEPEFEVVWKRPWEISENPDFLNETFSRFDVEQGGLGDCWLLASIATLTLHQDLFKNVVPEGQSFQKDKYAGIFHFRLWKANRWIDIVVDDRLPYREDEKTLAFVTSSAKNEFWSALLEKAYAKLHGGYAALVGGSGNEGLGTFTGGLTEQLILERPPKNLFQIIQKALERKSLITCSIIESEKGKKGLHAFHEYSVTGATQVPVEGREERLIRIRNPWGSGEWRGAWSDKSKKWAKVSDEKRQELGLVVKDDGEFWISEEDFVKYFQMLDFCHLDPGSTTGELKGSASEKQWEVAKFEGSWVPGSSAGGADDNSEKFATNPQYMVTLHEPDDEDEDGECTVIVALMQKNRRVFQVHDEMWLNIGFAVYEVEDPDNCPAPLTHEYLADYRQVGQSQRLSASRENTCRFRLLPGTFCVIPCTEEADQAGDFLLRIYTEKKCRCREHDGAPAIITKPGEDKKSDGGKVQPDKTTGDDGNEVNGDEKEGDGKDGEDGGDDSEEEIDQSLKDAFNEVASEDGTVCCSALKTLLKNVSEQDGGPLDFSLDICRSMVALIDDDYTGTLTVEEFAVLHKHIKQWKEAFKSYDKGSTGYLSTYALRNALRSAGYVVNQHVLKALVLRYGHDRKISLADFIGCAVKLMCMIDIYDAWDPEKENAVTVSRNEWLKYTMYC
ncbi:calpain-A-like isoform X2 [Dermacentor variabilis]|uniref:calpain-A-like isoform X2 n=1 Tax=Dermacentor variabilis TaxID=34621 RepID=UPI003F5B99DB